MLYFMPRLLFQETYSWISLGVLLIIIFGRINYMEALYFDEETRYIRLSKVIVFTTLTITIVMRVLLNHEYSIFWSSN
jgi:hypothetical protein